MEYSRGALLPSDRDPAAFAQTLHDLGYERLWTGELWGADAFVQLMRAAEVPIGLTTSIVGVYTRTPATIAQAAASVHRAAAGDLVLGIGSSTATAVETIHGRQFDRPVRRLHETAEIVTRLFGSDSRVEYEGEVVSTRGTPGLDVEIPVYTAALGEAARRATGRVADGWIPHNVPFDRYEPVFETIASTARSRGRDPSDVAVAPYVPCAVSTDEEEARDAIRGHLAYYVGSGEGYRDAVAASFPDQAKRIANAWADGDRDGARTHVTEEMIRVLGVAATPSDARTRFRELVPAEMVDAVCVVVPENAPGLVDQTIEALAPS